MKKGPRKLYTALWRRRRVHRRGNASKQLNEKSYSGRYSQYDAEVEAKTLKATVRMVEEDSDTWVPHSAYEDHVKGMAREAMASKLKEKGHVRPRYNFKAGVALRVARVEPNSREFMRRVRRAPPTLYAELPRALLEESAVSWNVVRVKGSGNLSIT